MGVLEGRVAVVTGAARGQGLAAARRFAEEGARVVLNDLDAGPLEAAREEVRKAGGEARAVAGDASASADVRRVLAEAEEAFGGLHVLYNNAGIGYSATKRFGIGMEDVVGCSEEDWGRVLDVNLGSVFLFCKYGIPRLLEHGGGVVINTASIAALRGTANAHAYSASKGAITALTRALAVTYGPRGLRANAICPGVIDTEMIHETLIEPAEVRDALAAGTPLRRNGTPEDVAEVAVFLASDGARFLNGESIAVDGGLIHRAF